MEKKKMKAILIASICIVSGLVVIFLIVGMNQPSKSLILHINNPTAETYTQAPIFVEITATGDAEIDDIWYNWDDGTNVSYTTSEYRAFDIGTHTISAWVNDTSGKIYTTSVDFTIIEGDEFVSSWDTSKTSTGSSTTNQIRLPLVSSGTYCFIVFWGDDSSDIITSYSDFDTLHIYATPGIYEINITGTCVGWSFNNAGDKLKLSEVKHWGVLNLGNSGKNFYGCSNLQITTEDVLNLTGTTNLNSTFRDCANLANIGHINEWDVSGVTDMSFMFNYAGVFDQDIGAWDVSSVVKMTSMFFGASVFNTSIENWDVSSVTDMSDMFHNAYEFKQNISNWDVSKVTNMSYMFDGAIVFNSSIGEWNVSSVTDMSGLFHNTYEFNQDLGYWNVTIVTTMSNMFIGSALTMTNYDSILNGWWGLPVQTAVVLDADCQYSASSTTAWQHLHDTHGWIITDGGIYT